MALVFIAALLLASIPQQLASAAPPANAYFERTWSRTDMPVAEQQVSRTWMWGPEAFTGVMHENFAESPGGVRTVQYFDKSRMEISELGDDPGSVWYVTNGLLVIELISGSMQTGLNSYEHRSPANMNVAGDFDDPHGPTYATFANLLSVPLGYPDELITSRLDRQGTITDDSALAAYDVTAKEYVIETNHRVASVFWEFMTSQALVFENGSYLSAALFPNPYYATGLPITEAYWAKIKVAGVGVDVLIQCFERRCLTYTPSNSPQWRVEAGNVGQHYFAWRYGDRHDNDGSGSIEPLPEVIWTHAYVNPEAAVTAVFVSNGYSTSSNSWLYEYYYQLAPAFPGLYSISTVKVGSFNHDTRSFHDWLNFVIVDQPGFSRDHLCAQVYAGIEQPDTEIARRLRQFELIFEQEALGLGAYAYWFYLLHPSLNGRVGYSPQAQDAFTRSFELVARQFAAAKLVDPNLTFAQYFIEREFHSRWCQKRD